MKSNITPRKFYERTSITLCIGACRSADCEENSGKNVATKSPHRSKAPVVLPYGEDRHGDQESFFTALSKVMGQNRGVLYG